MLKILKNSDIDKTVFVIYTKQIFDKNISYIW